MQINSKRSNRNREDVTELLDSEKNKANGIERWFEENKMARLETQIPHVMKQDLSQLKIIMDTADTGSKRTSNRLLAEALVDLFKKYQAGIGEFKLTEETDFKGGYQPSENDPNEKLKLIISELQNPENRRQQTQAQQEALLDKWLKALK